jgi:hypothetical protein
MRQRVGSASITMGARLQGRRAAYWALTSARPTARLPRRPTNDFRVPRRSFARKRRTPPHRPAAPCKDTEILSTVSEEKSRAPADIAEPHAVPDVLEALIDWSMS